MVSLHLLEGSKGDSRGGERCQHILDLVETYGRISGTGTGGDDDDDDDDDEDSAGERESVSQNHFCWPRFMFRRSFGLLRRTTGPLNRLNRLNILNRLNRLNILNRLNRLNGLNRVSHIKFK